MSTECTEHLYPVQGSADSDEPKMRKKGDGCGTMQKKKTMGNGMAEKTTSGSCDEVGNDVKGIAEIFKSNRFGIIGSILP